jgi:hypothetical protein
MNVFDTALDLWTKKNNIKTGRWCLSTVALDHMIYSLGGEPAPTSTGTTRVEIYDPVKDKCYSATGFLSKSYGQGACVYQNKIYVFGGCNSAHPTYESYKKGAEVGIPELN